MHHVADRHRVDRSGIVGDQQPACSIEVTRHTLEAARTVGGRGNRVERTGRPSRRAAICLPLLFAALTGRSGPGCGIKRDSHAMAERGGIPASLVQHDGRSGAVSGPAQQLVASLHTLEHPAREQRPVHRSSRFQVQAGRDAFQLRGHLRPAGVEAHAHDHRRQQSLRADGLGQNARQLAVVTSRTAACPVSARLVAASRAAAGTISDHQVIGPLQPWPDAAHLLARVSGGQPDRKRHQGRSGWRQRTRRRAQQHRHHERGARRRRPSAAAATAAGGLQVRDQHHSFGCPPAGPLEQLCVRGADLIVPLDIGEAGAGDRPEVR